MLIQASEIMTISGLKDVPATKNIFTPHVQIVCKFSTALCTFW